MLWDYWLVFFLFFIMQGLMQRSILMCPAPNLQNKQPLYSERSIQSGESGQKNSQITPWQGEELYSKIKKSIQITSRAKSATTKSAKYKQIENRATNNYSRVKTVHIQLTPFSTEPIQKSFSKRPYTSQINRKQNPSISSQKHQRNQNNYRFTTVSFMQPPVMPQRKLSVKNIQQKIKIQHHNAQIARRKIIQTNPKFVELDKRKSLMFFFQVRNHKVVNRQRMVMKIRNIQKGKANRAFNNVA